MKKRFIGALITMCAFCLTLLGCGSGGVGGGSFGGGANTPTYPDNPFVGYWQMLSASDELGEFVTAADMATLHSLGYESSIFIGERGLCWWYYTDTTFDFELDLSSDALVQNTTFYESLTNANPFKVTVILDGDTLTLSTSGADFTFKRVESSALTTSDERVEGHMYQDWAVNGNAVVDLSGNELYWLLWANSYEWNENVAVKSEPFGSASFVAIGPGKRYLSIDELRALNAGGKGDSVIYLMKCSTCTSAQETYEAFFGRSAADYAESGNIFVSTVTASDGTEYLVLLQKSGSSGNYGVWIAGQDGLDVLEGYLGGELGGSVSEAYANLAAAI